MISKKNEQFLYRTKDLIETIIGLKIRLKRKDKFITRTTPHLRYNRIINQLFPEKVSVLEVGAHKGDLIELFLRGIKHSNYEIYAVEPQDQCFETLKAKFSENSKISLFHHALGSMNQDARINVTENDEEKNDENQENHQHQPKISKNTHGDGATHLYLGSHPCRNGRDCILLL
mgnify:CR=1 FL=1